MANKRKPKDIVVLITGLLVIIVGLAGCGTSPEATTGAVGTARATPAAVEGAASPTSLVEERASPTSVAESDTTSEETPAAATGDTGTASCAKLNLNELTEEELMSTIPGFSSRMVREFFEYRPYVSIQQFRQEIGKYVDENQVAEYEKYVYVPVDPNNSDAATLKQIPGVDDTIAAELTAGRPYSSNDAFLQALSALVGEEQSAEAACSLPAN